MKKQGFAILSEKGKFLTEPIEIFKRKSKAIFHMKQIALDIGEDPRTFKKWKVVKVEVRIL